VDTQRGSPCRKDGESLRGTTLVRWTAVAQSTLVARANGRVPGRAYASSIDERPSRASQLRGLQPVTSVSANRERRYSSRRTRWYMVEEKCTGRVAVGQSDHG
jgi:hypothetical protein